MRGAVNLQLRVAIGKRLSQDGRVSEGAPTVFNVEADTRCRNCGAVLSGRFCQSCGQRVNDALMSFRQLLHEWLHEYLELDGKIGRTMRLLLFSPGRLTREFLDGRRVRYISPVRLYLIWSVAFFSLLSVTPHRQDPKPLAEQPKVVSSAKTTDYELVDRLRDRLRQAAIGSQKDRAPVLAKVLEWGPRVMFVLVPVLGLLVWLTYRKAVRFYLPHLYFAIHVHAFVFFIQFASQLIRIGAILIATRSIVFAVITLTSEALVVPYVIAALHCVYGGTWESAIFRGIAALVGYIAVMFAVTIVVLITAVLTLV